MKGPVFFGVDPDQAVAQAAAIRCSFRPVQKACTPIKKMDKPVGEWNTFVITMKGDHLTVELNGEVVIREAQLPGVPPEGEIALQRHGSPIEFRNIFIRELKANQ